MNEVVVLEQVSKRFKRYRSRGYSTLKDCFVRGSFLQRQRHQYVEALKNITLSIAKSSVVGLIGSNGAGKSTLLRLIAGIYRPTSGRISVSGRLSALLNLGLGFHPELSGRDNVFVSGLAAGLPPRQIRRLFNEIVRFAELEEFIDAPVRTYSSGMYMRLAFSIAVSVDPDILLLDEVLSVGDAHFSEKSWARMTEFKEQGKTIILATHDMDTVVSWCRSAIWLEDGQVRTIGEPARVVAEYLKASRGAEKDGRTTK